MHVSHEFTLWCLLYSTAVSIYNSISTKKPPPMSTPHHAPQIRIWCKKAALKALDAAREQQQQELRPQHSAVPRYSSLPKPPHTQLVFSFGEATQHPECRNLVGKACFGCNLDAQQYPMHVPYKNALIGKIQENPSYGILSSSCTNRICVRF